MDEKNTQKRVKRMIRFIILTGVILLIIVAGLAVHLYSVLDTAVKKQMGLEADEYKLRLMKQIDSDFQILDTLAVFIEQSGVASQNEVTQILDQVNNRNDFVNMGYFPREEEGTIVVRGQDPDDHVAVSSLEEEVQTVIQKAWAGERSVSRLFTGEHTKEKVFAYGIPVSDEKGKPFGAVMASGKMEIFTDILNDNAVLGGDGYIHLLGSEGDFLIRSPKAVVKEETSTIFEGPYLSDKAEAEVRTALQEGERVFSFFQVEGKIYQFLLEPVKMNGWYLLCVSTLQISNRAAYQIVRIMAVVCFGALILILFLMLSGYRMARRNNRELTYQAYHDPLTGSYNFIYFNKKLTEYLLDNRKLCVVAVNIHQFKFINEIFGKKQGDVFLCETKQLLGACLRNEEFFCRDTADLFYLCLCESQEEVIRKRMQGIMEKIAALSEKRYSHYHIRLYCGVAIADGKEKTNSDVLMTRVMFAMDTAKETIQNCIWFYDTELHKKEIIQNYIESHMEQALRDGEFKLYLQPKINLNTGQMESAEALVRWITKEGKMIFPDEFIPLFEKNGFCVHLDLYMAECACCQIRKWIDHGISPVGISVNQSKLLFYENDYISKIKNMIERYQIPAELITMEILEGLALENMQELNARIQILQKMGIRISMDDFGSGYSSLNTLINLEIDELKLDRTFLMKVREEKNLKSRLIMEQVVLLTKRMGIDTVVEGVETEEDYQFVKNLGCDYGQGYYYSRPVSAKEFTEKFLKKDRIIFEG